MNHTIKPSSIYTTDLHFLEDGLHPNAEGQKIMMENAKHVLIQLLNLNRL